MSKYYAALEKIEKFYSEEENIMVIATDSYDMLCEAISKAEKYDVAMNKIPYGCNSMIEACDTIVCLKAENQDLKEHISYLEGKIKLLETVIEAFEEENQILTDALKCFIECLIDYEDSFFIDAFYHDDEEEYPIIKKAMEVINMEGKKDE